MWKFSLKFSSSRKLLVLWRWKRNLLQCLPGDRAFALVTSTVAMEAKPSPVLARSVAAGNSAWDSARRMCWSGYRPRPAVRIR
eukprot:g67630.t1